MTVELEFEGAKVRRTRVPPLGDPLRRAARLPARGPDLRRARNAREEPWAAPLAAAARRVAEALAGARERRGALAVESVEPEFGFSRDGHVESLLPSEQTESHRLIEFLMIAANEAVAGLLEARKLPALYRVHEPPDPPRVERLLAQLASLDIPTPPAPEHLTPQQAGALVSEAATARCAAGGSPRSSCGRSSRRTTRRATSATSGCARRATATSRRRSGATRISSATARCWPRSAPARTRRAPSDMEAAGEWCSPRERDAMAIERTADNVARAFLLERELFENGWHREWDGEVAGLIGAGAFVAFDGYEGLLPVRRLRGDWWELNELETMLIGAEGGGRIRLGDPVRVQVEKVDAPRGRVDLAPVELSTSAG